MVESNADLIGMLCVVDRRLFNRAEHEDDVSDTDGLAWYSNHLTGAIESARISIRNLINLLERLEDGSDEPALD